AGNGSKVGLTHTIAEGLFTKYLLPFELTSVLLIMAIVGAMSLARRTTILSATARVVPGAQVLAMHEVNPRGFADLRAVESETSAEAAQQLGVEFHPDREKEM